MPLLRSKMIHFWIFLFILSYKSTVCAITTSSPTCSPDEKINGKCNTPISPVCTPDERINGECENNISPPTCSPDERIHGECKPEEQLETTNSSSISDVSPDKDKKEQFGGESVEDRHTPKTDEKINGESKTNISPTCSPDEKINGECGTNISPPTCSPDEKINGECKAEEKLATTNSASISDSSPEQTGDRFADEQHATKNDEKINGESKINISPTCSPDEKINGECKTNISPPTCSPDEKINGECKAEENLKTSNNSSISDSTSEKNKTELFGGKSTEDRQTTKTYIPILSPSDLPPPQIFTDWDPPTNSTISLPLKPNQIIAKGIVRQHKNIDESESFLPRFSVLPGIVPRETVAEVLSILHFGNVSTDFTPDQMNNGQTAVYLDDDPDTVDGMCSQEMYLDNDGLRKGRGSKSDIDLEVEYGEERTELRRKLHERLDPILEGIITPFVRSQYPEQCMKGGGRNCFPCYSLIRRYRAGDRVSHATHTDGHALVTVVVSFSDYNREYTGGVYVSTEHGKQKFVALNRGDALVHQADLYHGVKIMENDELQKDHVPERWSWILWFRDSESCEDHSKSWYKTCAEEGNPNCFIPHAGTFDSTNPEHFYWYQRACDSARSDACIKFARMYIQTIRSPYAFDPISAQQMYEKAMEMSEEPDAYYGLAIMLLAFTSLNSDNGGRLTKDLNVVKGDDPRIVRAVQYLEEAAKRGHKYAMFNLGMAHFFGYGYPDDKRNTDLAGEWWEASGLPEGYFIRAEQFKSLGKVKEAEELFLRATRLGFGTAWRDFARHLTGSGGAGGVDLNLKWPRLLPDGRKPPDISQKSEKKQ